MAVTKEDKQKILKDFGKSESDSGSSEVQIALLTARINDLTEHLKIHKKDFHSRRGLELIVSKRNRLLKYVYKKSHENYRELTKKLNIRAKLDRV